MILNLSDHTLHFHPDSLEAKKGLEVIDTTTDGDLWKIWFWYQDKEYRIDYDRFKKLYRIEDLKYRGLHAIRHEYLVEELREDGATTLLDAFDHFLSVHKEKTFVDFLSYLCTNVFKPPFAQYEVRVVSRDLTELTAKLEIQGVKVVAAYRPKASNCFQIRVAAPKGIRRVEGTTMFNTSASLRKLFIAMFRTAT